MESTTNKPHFLQPDALLTDDYLKIPQIFNAFESLKILRSYFHSIYIVSKRNDKMRQKTEDWLCHYNFEQLTEINKSNILFCRQRIEKVKIAEKLGITHFIDDRLEVLSYLRKTVPHLYLFDPNPHEVKQFSQYLNYVKVVSSWRSLTQILIS